MYSKLSTKVLRCYEARIYNCLIFRKEEIIRKNCCKRPFTDLLLQPFFVTCTAGSISVTSLKRIDPHFIKIFLGTKY